MAVTDSFCGGVLLSTLGVMGLAFRLARSKATETSSEAGNNKPKPSGSTQQPELESLRAINQVILLEAADEGSALAHLPGGVYGYAWAPHRESPLFREKKFQCFEVHKLPDGTVHFVGFVSDKEAVRLSIGDDPVTIDLYPDPRNESVKLVSIPLDRVLISKDPSRSDGNFLRLELDSAPDVSARHN
ncbi:MAG TPA: hypothetical protein VJH03_25580 [Blastocatellia bacterium]|nr:hypothetical protein [Blastocatellia bacterium]